MKLTPAEIAKLRYVPQRENEIIWLHEPDDDSIHRAVAFRKATLKEKEKYVDDNRHFLEPSQEFDEKQLQEFYKTDNYITLYGENSFTLSSLDFILAPAYNEKGEPLDVFGNLMKEDAAIEPVRNVAP